MEEKNLEEIIEKWASLSKGAQRRNILEVLFFVKNDANLVMKIWNGTKKEVQQEFVAEVMDLLQDNQTRINVWKSMNLEVRLSPEKQLKCFTFMMPEESEEEINQKFVVYKYLEQFNKGLRTTINFELLNQALIDRFGLETIVRISAYPDVQEMFLEAIYNPTKSMIIQEICADTDHKAIMINAACRAINNYSELFESMTTEALADKDLLKKIISILMSSEKNEFEIRTIDDVMEFDARKREKNTTILENSHTGLSEYDETILKRRAILELMYDIDLERAIILVESYGHKIEELKDLTAREKKIQAYIINIKAILRMDKRTIEAFYERFKEQISSLEALEYGSSYEIQEVLIELYERIFKSETYKLREEDCEYQTENYVHEDGTVSRIDVYEPQGDFCMFANPAGANEQGWTEPVDFKHDLSVPRINHPSNHENLIANCLLAFSRGTGPIYGYFDSDGLIMAGPYDMSQTKHSAELDPANARGYQANRIMATKQMIDSTRGTSNGFYNERLVYDKKRNILKKKMPDCVIWVDDVEYKTDKERESTRDNDPRWMMTKKAAYQLGVPIVIINREKCAKQELKKVKELTSIFTATKQPEGVNKAEVLKELLITFENNAFSIKFAKSKLKKQYFTEEDRKKLLSIIDTELKRLKIDDPEIYKECVNALGMTLFEELENNCGIGESRLSYFVILLDKYQGDMDEEIVQGLKEVSTELPEDGKEQVKRALTEVDNLGIYKMNRFHSISHISKVTLLARILAENEGLTEEEIKILMGAAAFHDGARNGSEGNSSHAKEGAKTAEEYFLANLENSFGISKEQIGLVQVAIHYHEYGERFAGKSDDDVIKELATTYGLEKYDFTSLKRVCEVLKDADALDRARFFDRGTLDPRMLRTATARKGKMIKYSILLNQEVARTILTDSYDISEDELENVDAVLLLEEKRKAEAIKGKRIEKDRRNGIENSESVIQEQDVTLEQLFEILGLVVPQRGDNTSRKKQQLVRLYKTRDIRGLDIQRIAKDLQTEQGKEGEENGKS